MFEEMEAIISGRVQGVRYRDFVQTCAAETGVCGFAENREDGTVRVVAQGTPDALKGLIDCLHRGSVLSHVETVAVTWRAPSAQFGDFSVKY
ncbi:acylphosphatase [Candidatus Kaiserbacteria bacterium]|nr:acylphosphatase [Candidatus Kaiserbacteria bacterium]